MILLYLALVWFVGIGLVRWLFPAPPRWSVHNVLLISLGAGVGIGIASFLYFLCLALFGPKIVVLAAVEGAALVAALLLGILAKRRGTLLDWAPGPPSPWYLTAAFGVALASALIMFIFYALNKPHGEWDAWSIWNLRARFFFRAGEFWRDAFSNRIDWSHPDYPLMLPGIVAMCWTLARAESTLAPVTVAFLFVFGLAGVLISTLGALRGKTQAFLAGIVLLGTTSVVVIGANQYADIPLSYYILLTLALLCFQERYPDDLRFSILAGLATGCAAWTKNEGLLFLVAVILARALAILRYGNRAVLTRQLLRLGAGLLAPLAVIVFFKLRFAPPNDLLARQPRQILAHLAGVGRWITVAEGYVKTPFRIGNFLIPIVLVLGLYWYLVRFKVEERDRPALATILFALGLTLAGEFAVYVAFPGDVVWQLNTSLERLFLQLWPAGLLAFFLAADSPQLLGKPKAAEKSRAVEKKKPSKGAPKPARRAAG
jgi:hypothetical protein